MLQVVYYAENPAGIRITVLMDEGTPSYPPPDVLGRQTMAGVKNDGLGNHDFSRISSLSVGHAFAPGLPAGVPAVAFSYVGVEQLGTSKIQAAHVDVDVLHDNRYYEINGAAPSPEFNALRAALSQVLANWQWSG